MQQIVPFVVTHERQRAHRDEATSLTVGPDGMTSADFALAGFDEGFFVMA
jgi:hypothetical protein